MSDLSTMKSNGLKAENQEDMEFAEGDAQIVPFDSLEPRWHVPGATEGGYLRYLTSWVGGPEGHINPNFGMGAVVSEDASVGYMKVLPGCRQKGVHAHTVVEIYIIIKGEIEGFDGLGETHRAGPMDCVYIPKGVPHGVRNSGQGDLELLWIHDGIEKKGESIYFLSEAETPKIGGVSVVPFNTLEPHWAAPRARQAPFLRYMISYVGAHDGFVNFNPKEAVVSDKCALGLMYIYPGNQQVANSLPGNQCYVVIHGKAKLKQGRRAERELQRLDGVWVPANIVHSLRNHGDDLLCLMWTHEKPQKIDSIKYVTDGT